MPHVMLTWEAAALIAALLVTAGWATLRFVGVGVVRSGAPFVREAGVILALYALWQLAGGLSLARTADAVHRGVAVWQVERGWGLPSEASVQRAILHHRLVVEACNVYYATMHFGVLLAMLAWVFVRHRRAYARVRTMIVTTTTACLLVGLVPVAPPRLVHVGMVDTAAAYGQSVYTMAGPIGADQYSAMPSVHVAWAALVPVAIITVSRSKWRWLILLHFVATVFVVVVTANHFWADGIVAVTLLGISLVLQAFVTWLVRRLRLRRLCACELAGSIDDDVRVH